MRKTLILSLILSFAYNGFAQQLTKITECVIEKGVLKDIEVDYNTATGDRSVVVNGIRKNFSDAYPDSGPDYAQERPWFINNDSIYYNGQYFKKYGLPRVLVTNEISKQGTYKGVGIYTEVGLNGIAEVLYIPVRPRCEFQPYLISCRGNVTIDKISSTGTTMQFNAKATGLTGNINYEWKSDGAYIVSGQGTSIVKIDVPGTKESGRIYLNVVVTDAKKCPISYREAIEVSTSGTASTTGNKSKWTYNDRKAFIDACIPNTGMTEANGRVYCSCMLEKIEKKYSNPATLEQEFKKEDVEPWAKECRPKVY